MIHIVNQQCNGPAIYIGRGSRFGNPYRISEHGDREEVIKLYREHQLPGLIQTPEFANLVAHHQAGEHVVLKCHCAPLHCHGDVIASVIRDLTDTKIIRLIIAGSRTFENYDLLCTIVDDFVRSHWDEQIEIVSGKARGADQLGERYAASRNIVCRHFPAPWQLFGKKAGPIRNRWMADYANYENGHLLAFWTGSKHHSGTWDMICQAERAGLNVQFYIVGKSPQQNELF